ncbi:hypothetical protein [Methanoregula sp.]|uniref:hypothetical protein n=1 Tax=Methanoregula sp. TaxID=2052170 RepID=UPI002CFDCD6C|nr:hypothetical protein [Methanoregula sp.]HVP97352.1 hypothetical protein [Methanoregula sp.]
MPKKTKTPEQTRLQKVHAGIAQATMFVEKNKNLIYIAIIGFCLSVTILYKLGQYSGWWA